MKIDKRIPDKEKWTSKKTLKKTHTTPKTAWRYPKDLDKTEGDPAGEGGLYINATHLSNRTDSGSLSSNIDAGQPEGTCKLCHGTTYQPIESRLARADPPFHRCVNCGHQEDYS